VASASAPVGGLTPLGCVGNSGSGPPSCIGADGLDGARSVAVSPDGKNVYVASLGSRAVVIFERVAGGGLKPMGCVGNSGSGPPSCIGADGLDGADSVAVSPDGKNVYVASVASYAVVLFERVAAGGLKPMGCVGNSGTGPPSCIGADGLGGAASVAVSPDGKNVYVASFFSRAVVLFSRVTESGAGGGGGATGNTNGAGTSVTTTVGNLRLTLSIAGSSACLAKSGPLRATLSSSTVPHSTGPSLHFIRASVFVDRGLRHVHRRSMIRNGRRVTVKTVTYSANRTVTSLPASISLKLAGLASGTHRLRVSDLFHETARRHGKRVTISVTKTQSAKFHVC
jgi:DNA-binding beta-propeller fold protein YncE